MLLIFSRYNRFFALLFFRFRVFFFVAFLKTRKICWSNSREKKQQQKRHQFFVFIHYLIPNRKKQQQEQRCQHFTNTQNSLFLAAVNFRSKIKKKRKSRNVCSIHSYFFVCLLYFNLLFFISLFCFCCCFKTQKF